VREARNGSTACCCSVRLIRIRGRRAATCRRARCAICRSVAEGLPTASAISSYGTSNSSRSTETARSTGPRRASRRGPAGCARQSPVQHDPKRLIRLDGAHADPPRSLPRYETSASEFRLGRWREQPVDLFIRSACNLTYARRRSCRDCNRGNTANSAALAWPSMGDTYRSLLRGFPGLATALLPRELELAEIVQALGSDDVRLLTLGGPPGAGKTRMAHVVRGSGRSPIRQRRPLRRSRPRIKLRTGYPRHCRSPRGS
jgi:hypothetical protein